jgi:MFS family permease
LHEPKKNIISLVIVAALGYFVDIYDLVLFSIVRVPSLKEIGLSGDSLLDQGVLLLNMQMAGMLIGGILWGILGDKKGRISVLFGSIFLYSAANIANGFVHDIPVYAILRFLAGVGLAGELGAGITLVTEVMPRESRGWGTTIVASVGVAGAVIAALIGDWFNWRTAYFAGGGMGIALLILRIGVYESGMYQSLQELSVSRGSFFKLFTNGKRFRKYLSCVMVGMPTWFIVGILITFSPEFAKVMGMTESISAGKGIMFCYIGLVMGDLSSGYLSQKLKSRKKVIRIYLVMTLIFMMAYLFLNGYSTAYFYTLCLLMGFGVGYWVLFVTNAAEQFGTNLRATVTTTTPNFIRGTVVPLTFLFQALKPSLGMIFSAALIALLTVIIPALSLRNLDETFGKDLDYVDII